MRRFILSIFNDISIIYLIDFLFNHKSIRKQLTDSLHRLSYKFNDVSRKNNYLLLLKNKIKLIFVERIKMPPRRKKVFIYALTESKIFLRYFNNKLEHISTYNDWKSQVGHCRFLRKWGKKLLLSRKRMSGTFISSVLFTRKNIILYCQIKFPSTFRGC